MLIASWASAIPSHSFVGRGQPEPNATILLMMADNNGDDRHMAADQSGSGLLNLTRVAAREAKGETGSPDLIYTLQADTRRTCNCLGSYIPSHGSATRLVATFTLSPSDFCPGVWDTGTGAFLGALWGAQIDDDYEFWSLITYQRSSDRRPRVAAGTQGGRLCIWDGDDLRILHETEFNRLGDVVQHLAVYEERTGRTRLVSA
jgi:hypothetical protein